MKRDEIGFSAVAALFVFLVIAVVGFGGWYVWHMNNRLASQAVGQTVRCCAVEASTTSRHLYFDFTTHKILVADATSRLLYSVAFPSGNGLEYQAVSPDNDFLVRLDNSAGTEIEGYMLIRGSGDSVTLDAKTVAILKLAYSGAADATQPPIYFVDDNNVIMTTCTSNARRSGSNCKLLSVNLASGQQKILHETSASIAHDDGSAYFYVARLSSDRKTAYLKTGDEHIGSTTDLGPAGTYAIDIASGQSE